MRPIGANYQNVHSVDDRNGYSAKPTGVLKQKGFGLLSAIVGKPIFTVRDLAPAFGETRKTCH